MRLLMLSSNWPPVTGGGAEAYVSRLADELRGRGHEVAAVTLGIDGPDVVASVPGRPHRLHQHAGASAAGKLAFHAADLARRDVVPIVKRAIRTFAPDVVHSHVVTGMSVHALTAPSEAGAPHVHTLHDHWLRCWRSTGTRRSQRPCGAECSLLAGARLRALRGRGPSTFVAISDAVARAHHGLGPERTEVIHHPADVSPRPRSTPPRIPPTFGFLGQLNPNKGVEVLLAAARRVPVPGVRVVIAGRGRLSERVATADVPGVESWGWVDGDGREAFFAAIDCLVVPSVWQEPAGLVVREAAARGIPVIASDIGGLPEYVPSSCRPLLFPAGDVGALTERMRRFADDPAAFRVDPDEVPDWSHHLDAMLDIYRSASCRTAAVRP